MIRGSLHGASCDDGVVGTGGGRAVRARRPRHAGAGARQPAPPLPPPINQIDRSAPQELRLAVDRPGQHGRPRGRHRGRREQSLDHLRRLRDRRHLEDRQQRHDVDADLRRVSGLVDRRHRDRAVQPRRHLRRHRRAEQPPELVVRRAASTSRSTAARRSSTSASKETQSIGRIVVHPKDPNIAYVAAVGHLFGPNPERGLYKTTDGGKTWTNTKFIDNDTGFTDVVMDPSNPNVLYRGLVPAPADAVGLQRRRPGQRHLEDDRRRQEVDEADGQRPSRQSDHRPHRPRHRALQADRRSMRRSKSDRAAAPAPA